MAYDPTDFVDVPLGETPPPGTPDLDAGELNKIGAGIADAHQDIGDLGERVANLEDAPDAAVDEAIQAHVALDNPHPQYLDQGEGDDRYLLESERNTFAPAVATSTALAEKQPADADLTAIAAVSSATAGALVTDGAGWFRKSYAQLTDALDVPAVVAEAVAADGAVVAAAASAVTSAAAALDLVLRTDPGVPTEVDGIGYALVEIDQDDRISRYVSPEGHTWLRLHADVELPGGQLVAESVAVGALEPGILPVVLDSEQAVWALVDEGNRAAAWITPDGSFDVSKAGPNLSELIGEGGGSVPGGELPLEVSDFVPSLEELEVAVLAGDVTATREVLLSAVNNDQRIGALTLASATAVSSSGSNYWTVALIRYRAGSAVTLATKSTNGAAISAKVAWTFDLVAWDSDDRILQKEDVLALTLTKSGSAADLTGLAVSWRYEPGVTA